MIQRIIGRALRQQQRLPTTIILPATATRCFASKEQPAQIEEQQHLGKQLSRLSENSQLQRQSWIETVRKFPRTNWSDTEPAGLHHYNSARYEHEGLAEIHHRSYSANVLLEIRDVRVPASSHHPSFTRLARHRTHLICYTHADLVDAPTRDRVEGWTGEIWPESRCIFVDTRSEGKRRDELHYFDTMYDGLLSTIEERGNNVALTVGVPNVGKSSVLMSLIKLGRQRGLIPKSNIRVNTRKVNVKKNTMGKSRLKRGSAPGILDTPGKTREITEYLMRDNPKAYFMDVPGITPPTAFFRERPEAWFGYGATNLLPLLKGAAADVEANKSFCGYVLSCANRDGIFQYVDKLNLDGPTDDIDEALQGLANKYKDRLDEEGLWLKRCENFLKLFNTGNFGPLVLDDMRDTSWEPFAFRDEHFQKKPREDYRVGFRDDAPGQRRPPREGQGRGRDQRRPANYPRDKRENRERMKEEPRDILDNVMDGKFDDEWFRNP